MRFHGRKKELTHLKKLISSDEMMLGLIYGRRRIGKSELEKQAIKAKILFKILVLHTHSILSFTIRKRRIAVYICSKRHKNSGKQRNSFATLCSPLVETNPDVATHSLSECRRVGAVSSITACHHRNFFGFMLVNLLYIRFLQEDYT